MDSEEWVAPAVDAVMTRVVGARRHLHRHPELSGQERDTASFVASRLRELGMQPILGLDGTAVVGVITGRGSEDESTPTLLLRADIDALPLTEADDGRSCRSERPGAMHACGHDAHTAILLGVAEVLTRHNDRFDGKVLTVFQPAEERVSGARAVLDSGLVPEGSYTAVLGLHVLAQLDVGVVGLRAGAIFASTDEFTIEVIGRPGHSGLPHLALDPVPAAASIVLQSQTLVTRECSPLDTAVVSIGTICGGTSVNGVAERVVLSGTVRAFEPDVRDRLLARIPQLAQQIAGASKLEAGFSVGPSTPAVRCDPTMVDLVERAAGLARDTHVQTVSPLPVADDVAEFLTSAPGCYFMLGAGGDGPSVAPHHTPEFTLDERCLPVGVEVLTRAATDYLSRPRARVNGSGQTVESHARIDRPGFRPQSMSSKSTYLRSR